MDQKDRVIKKLEIAEKYKKINHVLDIEEDQLKEGAARSKDQSKIDNLKQIINKKQ